MDAVILEVVLQAVVALMLAAAMFVLARGRTAARRSYALVAWLLPVSQLGVVSLMVHMALKYDASWKIMAIIYTVGLVCIAGDVLLVRGLDYAHEKTRAEEKARLLEEQVALQQSYFETLAAEREKAQQMRESFAEGLAKVRASIEQREGERALSNVDQAAQTLTPSMHRYCQHRVVDALLVGKEAEFNEAGVRFSCTVAIPDESDISDIVLCAAFSNVLNNALQACLELPVEQRWTEVKARVMDGHFVLRAENPCAPYGEAMSKQPSSKKLFRGIDDAHGWGLEILRMLAKDHDGTLVAERRDDRFVTELVLAE